ncbi:hypothetical protein LPJ64_003415, partial [Coemansia asiatica]
ASNTGLAEMSKISESCHDHGLEQPNTENADELIQHPKSSEGENFSNSADSQGTGTLLFLEIGKQQPVRTKRALDTFDLMDIEPPRRRQRKDDVDMA